MRKNVSNWSKSDTLKFYVILLYVILAIIFAIIFFVSVTNEKTNSLLLAIISWLLTVVFFTCFIGETRILYTNKAMLKKEKELRGDYIDYVTLVEKETDKILKCVNDYDYIRLKLFVSNSSNYIDTFHENLKWLKENKNIVNSDKFIIASCLLDSIIRNFVIFSENQNRSNKIYELMLSININLAMSCALELISVPFTYTMEKVLMNKNHEEFHVNIPSGIIDGSDIYQNITNTLFDDYLNDESMSIMQFANILRLIYLNYNKNN